jgi:hypothetical protein
MLVIHYRFKEDNIFTELLVDDNNLFYIGNILTHWGKYKELKNGFVLLFNGGCKSIEFKIHNQQFNATLIDKYDFIENKKYEGEIYYR